MDVTKQVKDYVLALGASIVGVPIIVRFDGDPRESKPEDLLPDARLCVENCAAYRRG